MLSLQGQEFFLSQVELPLPRAFKMHWKSRGIKSFASGRNGTISVRKISIPAGSASGKYKNWPAQLDSHSRQEVSSANAEPVYEQSRKVRENASSHPRISESLRLLRSQSYREQSGDAGAAFKLHLVSALLAETNDEWDAGKITST